MNPETIAIVLYIVGLVIKYGPKVIDTISEFVESLGLAEEEITLEMIKGLKIEDEEFIPKTSPVPPEVAGEPV